MHMRVDVATNSELVVMSWPTLPGESDRRSFINIHSAPTFRHAGWFVRIMHFRCHVVKPDQNALNHDHAQFESHFKFAVFRIFFLRSHHDRDDYFVHPIEPIFLFPSQKATAPVPRSRGSAADL